jgi:hypothetical protein
MKARVPRLSKKDKKKIKAEIAHELDKDWEEREQLISAELTRRIIKTFLFVMHEKHGYGKQRLIELIGNFTEKLDETSKDEVYWEHIDRVIIDRLGIPFERDYTEKGRAVSDSDFKKGKKL